MVSRPPTFCPDCGTHLESITFENRERMRCPDCDAIVWHNPVPCAGVAVVDRSRPEPAVLCVERGIPPGVGEWTIPGGHIEISEEPATAAARELVEETSVAVDSADLEILSASTMPPRAGKHVVTVHYVADRADAEGGRMRAATRRTLDSGRRPSSTLLTRPFDRSTRSGSGKPPHCSSDERDRSIIRLW